LSEARGDWIRNFRLQRSCYLACVVNRTSKASLARFTENENETQVQKVELLKDPEVGLLEENYSPH